MEFVQVLISRGHRLEDIMHYSFTQAKAFYEAIQQEKMDEYKTIISLITGRK